MRLGEFRLIEHVCESPCGEFDWCGARADLDGCDILAVRVTVPVLKHIEIAERKTEFLIAWILCRCPFEDGCGLWILFIADIDLDCAEDFLD